MTELVLLKRKMGFLRAIALKAVGRHLYALKGYDSTPVGKKTAVVIYKDIVDGFVITALLTSKPEQFVKRGKTIWKK